MTENTPNPLLPNLNDFQPTRSFTPAEPSSRSASGMSKTNRVLLFLSCLAILGGITTGAGLSALTAKSPSGNSGTLTGEAAPVAKVATGEVTAGQTFGSSNEAAFKDNTEGYLVSGGIEGEGSHHVLRAGGITQTVYLTSSVTDLSKFENMCVKIWGETFKGQKAGWLMDVGRIQVIDTKCQAPFEEKKPAAAKVTQEDESGE